MDSSHSQIFNINYFVNALTNISTNKINDLCKYRLLPSIKQKNKLCSNWINEDRRVWSKNNMPKFCFNKRDSDWMFIEQLLNLFVWRCILILL